jgi:hypothetical protein
MEGVAGWGERLNEILKAQADQGGVQVLKEANFVEF